MEISDSYELRRLFAQLTDLLEFSFMPIELKSTLHAAAEPIRKVLQAAEPNRCNLSDAEFWPGGSAAPSDVARPRNSVNQLRSRRGQSYVKS